MHLTTVIQRALWHWKLPGVFDKARLRADLEEQVEQRLVTATAEQMDRLVDNLWADVDLTRQEAGLSKVHNP